MGSVNKMLQNIASISKVLQECTGESVLCRQTPGMNSNKKKILFNFSAGTLCVGRAGSILQSKCLTLQPRRNEFRQDAAVLLQALQASWILHWQVKSIRSPEHKELLALSAERGAESKAYNIRLLLLAAWGDTAFIDGRNICGDGIITEEPFWSCCHLSGCCGYGDNIVLWAGTPAFPP